MDPSLTVNPLMSIQIPGDLREGKEKQVMEQAVNIRFLIEEAMMLKRYSIIYSGRIYQPNRVILEMKGFEIEPVHITTTHHKRPEEGMRWIIRW